MATPFTHSSIHEMDRKILQYFLPTEVRQQEGTGNCTVAEAGLTE